MDKRIILLMSVFLAFAMFPSFALATTYNLVPNGSFETGDNQDWNTFDTSKVYLNGRNITFGSASYDFNATDGNFLFSNSQSNLGSYNFPEENFSFCTDEAIIEPNQIIDFNMWSDWAGTNSGVSNTIDTTWLSSYRYESTYVYVNAEPNIDLIDGAGSYNIASSKVSEFDNDDVGYKSGTITNDGNNSYLCFVVGTNRVSSGSNGNTLTSYVALDDIRFFVNQSVDISVTEPDEPVEVLDPFQISATASSSGTPLTNAEVDLDINFNGAGYTAMSYSGGTWTYTNTGLGQGNYDYTIRATGGDYVTTTTDGTIEVTASYEANLVVTNIDNVSHTIGTNSVNISPNSIGSPSTFSVENVSSQGFSIDVNYNILNNDKSDKQYFIYTSTDGVTYTLSTTLTFGSDNTNPVQKIYDASTNAYTHSFEHSINPSQKRYYKIEYEEVPLYWETIGQSNDWIDANPSQVVSEDNGNHYYDLIQNSSVTQINSYTKDEFPDLTSVDLTTGFYLQFNAYAETPLDLEVGYRIGTADTTESVTLTTGWNRYSVLIDPSDNNSQLLIKSDSTTSARVYFSDYAVIPSSYFVDNIELTGTSVLVRDGVSNEVLREMIPFGFTTKFYDREEVLSKMLVQVILDGNVVKTYEYNLNENDLDTSTTIEFSESLDSVIDYSGKANSGIELLDLKNIVVKAILVNSSDQNVSEQHKQIKFLQYPYFQSDLSIGVLPISKKVGDLVKFNLNLINKEPDALIGFDIYVSTTQNIADALYDTTIYADDLGCASLLVCNKTITLDEFAFPSEDEYFIIVEALLTTEAQESDNLLTRSVVATTTSYYEFETARLLQLFERRDLTYKNSEHIPLVFQVRNDNLENLQSDYVVWLNVDVNDNGSYTEIDLNFSPQQFIYDEVTGYNYWLWNGLLYDDTGSLIPDGNALRFKAYVNPVTEKSSNPNAYGLVNKCDTYPSDFFNGTLLMNWIGLSGDVTYGCTNVSQEVVQWDDTNAVQLIMDNDHAVSSNQNHSVFCYRSDTDLTFKKELGDEFVCGTLYLKDEEQIDGFNVYLGNGYSDYDLTGDEAQYINFEIDGTTAMFNDVLMMKKALEFNQDTEINTLGELLSAGINELLPYGQGVVDSASLIQYFVGNAGSDINLSNQLDPTIVQGVVFFKVKGLNVINKYDYLELFPELEEVKTQYFRRFMNENNAYYPVNEATIILYGRDMTPFQTFKLDSPIVIDEAPKEPLDSLNTDQNVTTRVVPTALKFDFIVDMLSANKTKGARAYVPIIFSYVVPQNFSIGSLLGIGEDFTENPLGFVASNWFLIVMLILFVLIVSLIYANFKGGGGVNIQNFIGKKE